MSAAVSGGVWSEWSPKKDDFQLIIVIQAAPKISINCVYIYLESVPELVFDNMDVTDMSYEDGSYSVVLDKGTLYTDISDQVEDTVMRMWTKVSWVLRIGGRYVCVSLLQPHILASIVKWFSAQGWPVRIIRCPEADANKAASDRGLPVFVVVATKFKAIANMKPMLEFSLSSEGQLNRLQDTDSLVDSVRGCQQFTALRARYLQSVPST